MYGGKEGQESTAVPRFRQAPNSRDAAVPPGSPPTRPVGFGVERKTPHATRRFAVRPLFNTPGHLHVSHRHHSATNRHVSCACSGGFGQHDLEVGNELKTVPPRLFGVEHPPKLVRGIFCSH